MSLLRIAYATINILRVLGVHSLLFSLVELFVGLVIIEYYWRRESFIDLCGRHLLFNVKK